MTMSYSDQPFRFASPDQQRSGIWGKSGQNKSPVFANGDGRCNSFLKILNCDYDLPKGLMRPI